MKKNQLLIITNTALVLALLLTIQFMTRSFGQFVTGSLVNLLLLVAVLVVDFKSGLFIGAVSPFLANLLGIGPAFIQIVFFVSLANIIFICVAWTLVRKTIESSKRLINNVLGLFVAACLKTAFLWVILVNFALPFIPGINEKQLMLISLSFSWPQLITSLGGSLLAILIIPALIKAKKSGHRQV